MDRFAEPATALVGRARLQMHMRSPMTDRVTVAFQEIAGDAETTLLSAVARPASEARASLHPSGDA